MKRVTATEWANASPELWIGRKLGQNRLFTGEQEEALAREEKQRGREFLNTFKVRHHRPHPTLFYHPGEIVSFVCPLLAVTKTARLIITPSGSKHWLHREGLNR